MLFKLANNTLAEREKEKFFDKKIWFESFKVLKSDELLDKSGLHLNYRNLHKSLINLALLSNDNGTNLSVVAHIFGGLYPVLKFGNIEQKNKYLPGLIEGELISALAYSDDKNQEVICEKNPDNSFTLRGNKKYITNACVADVFVVYAITNFGKVNTFLVEAGTAGLSIKTDTKLTGLNTSGLAHLAFEDCVLDEKCLLGSEGDGVIVFNSTIEKERIFTMSLILGRLYYLKKYFLSILPKKMNSQSGHFDTLVYTQNAILTVESLLLKVIESLELNENIFLQSAQVKSIIPKIYQDTCLRMIQAMGAAGVDCENELERELRDSLASSIYSGKTEVLNEVIYRLSRLS
jgi:alkylation response protein AidB-like acyl-CoA dehydrogenase